MVTILPAAPRNLSKSEQFAHALEGSLKQFNEMSKQRQQHQALSQMGVDPAVLSLPQEAQAAYFKNAFSPEKSMTPLQQSQQALNEERLRSLQQQQGVYKNLFGGGQQQSPQQGLQEGGFEPQDQGFDLKNISKEKLRQGAAFAGQPGEMGVVGNMFKAELERQEKEEKESPSYQRQQILTAEQAKNDIKFYNDLNERRSKQILKKDSLQRLKNLTKRNVTGKVYESFLEKMGLTALTSEGRREYSAEAKNQFTDFKQIAGSQLSAAEFFILAGAYPNADFTPEANKAIIENLELVHETLDKEYEIAQKLKKENKNQVPEYAQEKVNKELNDFVSKRMDRIRNNIRKIQNAQYGIPEGNTLMFDNEGQPLSVPDDKIVDLIEEGLANLP